MSKSLQLISSQPVKEERGLYDLDVESETPLLWVIRDRQGVASCE